jgi:hypothetical protein
LDAKNWYLEAIIGLFPSAENGAKVSVFSL